jgi:peptidyl-prolyl cis-trans isomerase A (cyclophilin A)
MRQSLSIFSVLLLVVGFTGCRNKSELELYYPGDTKVWQTSDTGQQAGADSRPLVELETNKGKIVIELFEEEAPVSVANFLQYVNDGFYDGTIFHRVEPGMGVIQGGGFTVDMVQKDTLPPIINEAGNGLRNNRGTIGAARTRDMNSATSQFYINLVNNPGFNGDGVRGGYAVFGRVYEGMSVVDAIALEETGSAGGMSNVPLEPVIVMTARQVR